MLVCMLCCTDHVSLFLEESTQPERSVYKMFIFGQTNCYSPMMTLLRLSNKLALLASNYEQRESTKICLSALFHYVFFVLHSVCFKLLLAEVHQRAFIVKN